MCLEVSSTPYGRMSCILPKSEHHSRSHFAPAFGFLYLAKPSFNHNLEFSVDDR